MRLCALLKPKKTFFIISYYQSISEEQYVATFTTMTMANKRVTYRIMSTLGQGTNPKLPQHFQHSLLSIFVGVFGTVFKAQSSEGELVAIKRVAVNIN